MLCILSRLLRYCYVPCDSLAEVIDDQAGPGFLFNVLAFLAMEMNKIDGVFQVAERVFLPPTVVFIKIRIT